MPRDAERREFLESPCRNQAWDELFGLVLRDAPRGIFYFSDPHCISLTISSWTKGLSRVCESPRFVLRQDRQLWPSAEPLAYLQAVSRHRLPKKASSCKLLTRVKGHTPPYVTSVTCVTTYVAGAPVLGPSFSCLRPATWRPGHRLCASERILAYLRVLQ